MTSFLSRLFGRGSGEPAKVQLPIPSGPARDVAAVLEGETQGAVDILLPATGDDGQVFGLHGVVLDVQHMGPVRLRPGDASLPEPADLHRIAELTVVLSGDLEHRDALGNRGRLTAPAARLVSSGAGLRSEVGLHRDLVRDGGAAEVLTVRWAQSAAVTPTVRLRQDLPEQIQGRTRILPLVGTEGAVLPSPDGVTVTYAEVPSGGGLDLPIPEGHVAALMVLDGAVLAGDTGAGDEHLLTEVTAGRSALLAGGGVRCSAATRLEAGSTTVLLVTSPPAPDLVVSRRGQLVHSTPEELEDVQARLRDGAFGQLPRS